MKRTALAALFLLLCICAKAQMPRYPMVFAFSNSTQEATDTSMSYLQLNHWAMTGNFPATLKWKNSLFALKKDNDTVRLCTDSVTSYDNGDVIGFLFFKTGVTGTFRSDYKISNIGKYIFGGASPNVDIEMTADGIRMKAHGTVTANTVLSINFQDLYDLFPDDPTIAFVNY